MSDGRATPNSRAASERFRPAATRIALRVHPEVAAFLTERAPQSLEALERQAGRTVALESVPELGRDQVEVRLGG